MLPKTIDHTSRYQFKTADRDGHLFVMLVDQHQAAPIEPLWIRICGNEESRQALQQWLSVRRDEWQELGKLAHELGYEAFAGHVETLMSEAPPGIYQATVVNRPDDDRQVAFSMYLSTGGIEPLYVHTFASAEKRDRFFEWFHSGKNELNADKLVDIAFEKGTLALASELDAIADKQTSRPRRKAA